MTNFNLSDKRKELMERLEKNKPVSIPLIFKYIQTQDKEFIRLFREIMQRVCGGSYLELSWNLDKLAGKELSK